MFRYLKLINKMHSSSAAHDGLYPDALNLYENRRFGLYHN
jgi:hypothetical protein